MRVRSALLVSMLLPVVAGAQRNPRVRLGGGRVAPPTALPPQPGILRQEMSYVHLPISAESYTFVSYTQTTNLDGNALTSWGTLMAALRLDLALSRHFSATADLTQSVYGGPASSGSIELGTRFKPVVPSGTSRLQAYVDGRVGYLYSSESYLYSSDPSSVNPFSYVRSRVGNGTGVVAGAGSEFCITRNVALTTGVWASRSRINGAVVTGFQATPQPRQTYYINSYRLALGVKWNPGHYVPVDEP